MNKTISEAQVREIRALAHEERSIPRFWDFVESVELDPELRRLIDATCNENVNEDGQVNWDESQYRVGVLCDMILSPVGLSDDDGTLIVAQ